LPALVSVPEPDITWVRYRRYAASRPKAVDVLLLIEVARSSLKFDLGEKALLYAKARIADYWVVDLPHRCVKVFRDPQRGRYRSVTAFEVGDEIQPLSFPKISLAVARLFPT
jgi:Uma2 family endonuclease